MGIINREDAWGSFNMCLNPSDIPSSLINIIFTHKQEMCNN